jgi:two-component system, cell cycle sensor histidine kinase and response regulator CckA
VGKGTGLGLATVYGIVKQHQGYIWVDSAVGQGTTFEIHMPRIQTAPASQADTEAAELPRGHETVLVVEDEAAVRNVTVRSLVDLGYTVLVAANGAEALQVAESYAGTIHLLLTDVVMPGMSGKVLADRLVTLRPDVAVLFTSGYTDDAIVHHGVLEGGLAFLQKPFTTAALARKVRTALEGK